MKRAGLGLGRGLLGFLIQAQILLQNELHVLRIEHIQIALLGLRGGMRFRAVQRLFFGLVPPVLPC